MSILLPVQVKLILYVCDAAGQVSLMHKVFLVCSFKKLFLLHLCHLNLSSLFSTSPFTGSNDLPSVFVNNLGYCVIVCTSLCVCVCARDVFSACVCVCQSAD